MEVLAKAKYIRVSPKKVRQIADAIRGKNARTALEIVKAMPHSGAEVIKKVLASAMANAENNFNLDKDALTLSTITVDGGPTLKRWRPRAKGAASSIKKRTSHITVVVSGEIQTKVKKTETKEVKAHEKSGEDEHKIEVERPQFVEKKPQATKADVKTNKVFRRKTG
jgi:large subunit ribosomal protein L22